MDPKDYTPNEGWHHGNDEDFQTPEFGGDYPNNPDYEPEADEE